jgi:hypothetical protein
MIKAYITNVQRGSGSKRQFIYAEVRAVDGNELLIAATLSYCLQQAYERYVVVSKWGG